MLKPCVTPGCEELVGRGQFHCTEHAPVPWEGSPRTRDQFGITEWEWQKIRHRVIRRDRGVCVLCGRKGKEVDHIIPAAHGGSNHMSNLRLLCTECHRRETARIPRRR